MGKIKILCAFPLCGKSYTFWHQSELNFGRIMNSDPSVYHWLKERNADGVERMSLNPDFPKNYIDNALEFIDDGADVVLLSTDEAVLRELNSREIDYYICYPSKYMRFEWLRRAHKREFDGFDPDILFSRANFNYMIENIERLTADFPDRRYVFNSSGLYVPDVLEYFGFKKDKKEEKGVIFDETS